MPQSWFVERIAGTTVQTVVLVGPSQNPHDYEPSPKQLSALAHAKVWVLAGIEFEISLRPKVEKLFPNLHIIDGTEGVNFHSLAEDSGAHDIDRHSWLGHGPALIMASHIKDALCLANESGTERYIHNLRLLKQEIDTEFEMWREELSGLAGTTVFVYHPAFGYFLDEFGIKQEAVETGGKEPTPRQLAVLIEKARQENVRTIFVQAQFPLEAAVMVADTIGAQVVSLDPLSSDWLGTIRAMGQASLHR